MPVIGPIKRTFWHQSNSEDAVQNPNLATTANITFTLVPRCPSLHRCPQVSQRLSRQPDRNDFGQDPRQHQWSSLDRRGLRTWSSQGRISTHQRRRMREHSRLPDARYPIRLQSAASPPIRGAGTVRVRPKGAGSRETRITNRFQAGSAGGGCAH